MLEVRDLWVHPPGASEPAVKGVSLRVAEGEWLAVTGPNGCGKSSLALAAAGLWPARRGEVFAHGVPLAATPAGRAAAGVTAVLQEPSAQLFERTVAEEIGFAARNLGMDALTIERRVTSLAERFGLTGASGRPPQELSAGEQQRVLLAAALATEPRILIVDEGTAHLDSGSRALALEAVRERLPGGTSVLWVTQEQAELDAADRVMLLPTGGEPATAVAAASRAGPRGIVASRGYRVRISEAPWIDGPRVSCPIGGLEFEVSAGRPVALMGRNGAGKSITLEAIAGVVAVPQIEVDPPPGARGFPILVAQFPELQIFGDTVREEIEFGVAQRGGERRASLEMALQLLQELKLDSRMLDRSPWDLSTGERRLVQVVAALAAPSSLILLDEPTCGIDRTRAAALAGILASASDRIPLLIATQDKVLTERLGTLNWTLGG